jgi:hypothetical protein
MPPRCTGKVETKVNPFFKIAKEMMMKLKSKATGNKGGSTFNDDFNEGNQVGAKTKANTDF